MASLSHPPGPGHNDFRAQADEAYRLAERLPLLSYGRGFCRGQAAALYVAAAANRQLLECVDNLLRALCGSPTDVLVMDGAVVQAVDELCQARGGACPACADVAYVPATLLPRAPHS